MLRMKLSREEKKGCIQLSQLVMHKLASEILQMLQGVGNTNVTEQQVVIHRWNIETAAVRKEKKITLALNQLSFCNSEENGIGPQNGAQYGAPFVEEEWEEQEIANGVVLMPDAEDDDDAVDAHDQEYLEFNDLLQETSSTQYILQQYIAASGGFKLLSSIRNTYSMGKVRMVAIEFETATRITKNRNPTRDAESGFSATIGVEVCPLYFFTNCGKIRFNCWDTGGQKKFGGPRDGYYINGHCAIILFDVTARLTYKNVPTWHRDIWFVSIPIVLCGNKVDVKNRQVKAKQVTFHRMKSLQYYEISAKSNYNFEKPFLYLARKLAGYVIISAIINNNNNEKCHDRDPNLHFVESPALAPPEVQIDLAAQQQRESELAAAAAQPLPDDGDDLID
ncbi:hypothetical protein ZIOFF_048065 [Zingiber officinale]|uniref:GTP-binding nuclear protein n=1 Tax=Zingiber officinale TaxID=94328 RepID=A0A8J5FSM7_ZINOF|nr:hypothetical protein ZIOFF_048065 [Zingiber officinale]